MGALGLAALAAAPSAPTLTSLTCTHSSTAASNTADADADAPTPPPPTSPAAAADTAAAVGALMRACTSLQQLRLPHMGLGDAGAAAVANAIQQQGAGHCLQMLDLGHNCIGGAGG